MILDILACVLFVAIPVIIICTAVSEKLPRGLRWLWPIAKWTGKTLRHYALRVFYPEYLDPNGWRHPGCSCKRCSDRRTRKAVAQAEEREKANALSRLEELDREYRKGNTQWHDTYGWIPPMSDERREEIEQRQRALDVQYLVSQVEARFGIFDSELTGVQRDLIESDDYDAVAHESRYP